MVLSKFDFGSILARISKPCSHILSDCENSGGRTAMARLRLAIE